MSDKHWHRSDTAEREIFYTKVLSLTGVEREKAPTRPREEPARKRRGAQDTRRGKQNARQTEREKERIPCNGRALERMRRPLHAHPADRTTTGQQTWSQELGKDGLDLNTLSRVSIRTHMHTYRALTPARAPCPAGCNDSHLGPVLTSRERFRRRVNHKP